MSDIKWGDNLGKYLCSSVSVTMGGDAHEVWYCNFRECRARYDCKERPEKCTGLVPVRDPEKRKEFCRAYYDFYQGTGAHKKFSDEYLSKWYQEFDGGDYFLKDEPKESDFYEKTECGGTSFSLEKHTGETIDSFSCETLDIWSALRK